MLFLGNARESSVPLFVPPKYPPSRMDYPLLANIPDHETTAPCGSHVNSKQKSSHSKEPLIMQFFSNHPLSVTVSVTCLHILLQLEKQLLEKGCLCLKQQNVRHTPTCEEGSQNFCVPEIEFQKLSMTSRLTSDNLKVVLLRFPGLCKRCWSQ